MNLYVVAVPVPVVLEARANAYYKSRPERPRKAQRHSERPRETQRGSERPRQAQSKNPTRVVGENHSSDINDLERLQW